MIKRKFGDSVRSKTVVAIRNQVLAKVLCHNMVVVIHEMGIKTGAMDSDSEEPTILQLVR